MKSKPIIMFTAKDWQIHHDEFTKDQRPSLAPCDVVGWYFNEDAECMRIALQYFPDDNKYSSIIVIPKKNIVGKIYEVKCDKLRTWRRPNP